MNLTKRNREAWYQVCLALLVSVSLIACSDESSSNNDDGDSNQSSSRVVNTPSGDVTIESNGDSRTVNAPEFDVTDLMVECDDDRDTFSFGGTEVDVCG